MTYENNERIVWEGNWAAGTRKTLNINGVEFAFRYCPPGTFTMGSPASETGRVENPFLRFFHDCASPEAGSYGYDEVQFRATITRGFWTQETPVTQTAYKATMGMNPSYFASTGNLEHLIRGQETSRFPVENVSWFDAWDFIDRLNASGRTPSGFEFRLPTEAEWEYACRAGTTGRYNIAAKFEELGWTGNQPRAVGQKRPNAWGIYDMHGNVKEWCDDWYEKKYPCGSATDPTGPSVGKQRVLRGGSWACSASYYASCRAASRDCAAPTKRDFDVGFRLILGRKR